MADTWTLSYYAIMPDRMPWALYARSVLAVRQTDPSSHGGQALTGYTKVLVGGRPAARMGDAHACPQPGHGTTAIAGGSAKVLIGGRPAARAGDAAACGATLTPSQGKVFWG
ncbi:hypothetical protein Thermus72351_05460 [Thermus brockianus]